MAWYDVLPKCHWARLLIFVLVFMERGFELGRRL